MVCFMGHHFKTGDRIYDPFDAMAEIKNFEIDTQVFNFLTSNSKIIIP